MIFSKHLKLLLHLYKYINYYFSGKIISYLPEPLSNVGGIPIYGLDEYSCLELLHEALSKLIKNKEAVVLIKPHPNQKADILKEKILDLPKIENVSIKIIDIDINVLMYYLLNKKYETDI